MSKWRLQAMLGQRRRSGRQDYRRTIRVRLSGATPALLQRPQTPQPSRRPQQARRGLGRQSRQDLLRQQHC